MVALNNSYHLGMKCNGRTSAIVDILFSEIKYLDR